MEDLAKSDTWRVFRIMAELVEGFEALNNIGPAVTIFGSARLEPGTPYYNKCLKVAESLAHDGFAIISGGGPGIMEAANKGAQAGKGPSVGLNIQLPHEQSGNAYQDISLSFRHFFARKVMFVKYASAYVVLPGGFGTLDELMEIMTLIQTGKSRRIPVILVHAPFWQGLLAWFRDTLVPEGTISAEDLDLITVLDDAQDVLQAIFRYYEHRGFEPSVDEEQTQLNL